MTTWKDFELEMTEYIKEELKNYDVKVRKYGDSNSRASDIEIIINPSQKIFYIEIKMPVSQTSQFVLEIINNKFVYSHKNRYPSNEYSEKIIKVLNNNFPFYNKVSQKRIIVPISKEIAFGWIISNMQNKNVEFITSVDNKGNKKIFSLKDLNSFFTIKTILRRKKSGTSYLPKVYYEDFIKCLSLKYPNNIFKIYHKNNKLIIKFPFDLPKEECYLQSNLLSDNKKYYLSNKGKGRYVAKVTSVTNNPNIIFTLSLKNNIDFDMFTIQCLFDYIINNM